MQLTTNGLRAAWRGKDQWISDGGARGGGRLVARVTRDGVALLFQYFAPDGRKRFFPLGPYDANGTRGLSLPKARDRAAELSSLYRSGTMDLHGHFQREHEAQERVRKAAEDAARRAQEAAQRSTLKQLLDAYVGHLERQGKQSAGDVASIFDTHVYKAAPELGSRKAAEVTIDEFVGLIGKLTEAGKGRTAAKLRSYLRAAYSLAIRSKTDPSAPLGMRAFGVEVNPLASVGALSQYSRARDRVLSGPELAAFLKRLDALEAGPQRDALQLCLMLGGQRPAQLLRAKPADVDIDASTIVLYDPKGARQQPRRHVLPLTSDAGKILKRRIEEAKEGAPVFSTDGHSNMRHETVSALVTDISETMVTEKEARSPFQLRDIRRTCETMLASLKVSSDVRAQLQSHGLGGVQQRHYDRHEYSLEKRAALEKWSRHLAALKAGKQADVVQLPRGKKRTSGGATREEAR
jgi:integrase